MIAALLLIQELDWTPVHDCTKRGSHIEATGADPYLHSGRIGSRDRRVLHLRMKSAAGRGQIFWTDDTGSWAEERSAWFDVAEGTHAYEIPIWHFGTLAQIRLDPPGSVDVEESRLEPLPPMPTSFDTVRESKSITLRSTKGAARVERDGKILAELYRCTKAELVDGAVVIGAGTVVRVLGALEQGLFAGLEYLGKGEKSSSDLDIETAERFRHYPLPSKVTMPLMAIRTDRGTVALTWTDMTRRPTFFDDLMSLDGDARLTFPATLEDAILSIPLPALPERPKRDQGKLCLKAFDALKGERGWGHCAEPNWGREPYADHASTIWRLSGEIPKIDPVPGGAHIRNDAIWFLGRADAWLRIRKDEARAVLREQKEDGSFRYDGPYRRGHFEDTSSGLCAQKAMILLEHAWLTGDGTSLDAGLKALEFLKRFRTPRGAQTWELSLHTPDILASAYLVWCCVRGYQLTGKKEHLEHARKWAATGLPFIYYWGPSPYATVPVYGATNWRAPNWIGLPVQWCGIVYAYALVLLSPYDARWRQVAEGILLAGEKMQYPDGKLAGCLPDVFHLADQRRDGPSINPCSLVSLRLALEGEVDSLSVAWDGAHRVVAPFPVELRDGQARIRGRKGLRYQVVVDGDRVVEVESKGEDVLDPSGRRP